MKTKKKENQVLAMDDAGADKRPDDSEERAYGSESQATSSLIGAIIDKTHALKAHPSHHASLLGTCLCPFHPDRQGLCEVRFEKPDGTMRQEWLQYIDGIALRENDSVLLITPRGSDAPIVVGRLAGAETHLSWEFPSGHKLIVGKQGQTNETCSIRLEMSDGRTALEIDLHGKVPTVRLPDKDLSLDLEGRLKIAARSIDLVSKLGNVNVKANDDFKVTAERIWLN